MRESAGFYLAVMPRYRRACTEIVRESYPGDLSVWVSEAHQDPSVRTDTGVAWYERVRMLRVRRPAVFLQVGHWRDAWRQGTTVVDLNPRSVTAWLLLGLRRATGRRVLVWGHVHPRAGQDARTAPVRRLMRRLAHGTISYTVADAADARAELPGSPVWVATNALYPRDAIRVSPDSGRVRDELVYVGRFVRAKKVDLLVRAFAVAHRRRPGMRLTLVGDGEQRAELERLVRTEGLDDAVTFAGWVDEVEELRAVYARAFAAVSPGFAGLSLTQAAGFGVPTLVSRDEPHSPEIELADHGAVRWFPTDSVEGLAQAALAAWDEREQVPDRELSVWVREAYSAESMARGLVDALGARVARTQEVGVA